MMPEFVFALAAALICGAGAFAWWVIRSRGLQCWLPEYVRPRDPSGSIDVPLPDDETVHVFIAVCDHYEPEFGEPSDDVAMSRVQRWVTDYPRLLEQFRDCDGRKPQWTFFFPQDQYRPEYLDALAELCDDGFGDVDVHLHHGHDTPEGLRDKLESFRETLYHRHGLLRRDPVTGEIVYGFIHGDWALCNSGLDDSVCGVNDELTILQQTGCYADFTMPSAPSETQPRTINSIYYARDLGGRPKSHGRGIRASVGQPAPEDHLLMIQGPLLLDWSRRKFGFLPRTENADLHVGRPASWKRMQLWLRAGVHVAGRPNWKFVKLHTHGCNEENMDTLLSPAMQHFHVELAQQAERNPRFKYHYVTAWEMAQLVHQAEAGATTPLIGQPLPVATV